MAVAVDVTHLLLVMTMDKMLQAQVEDRERLEQLILHLIVLVELHQVELMVQPDRT